MKPAKRGDYISIRHGNARTLHPVTGVHQQAEASLVLRDRNVLAAPIVRWTGSDWVETGRMLHAASDICRVHDKDDPVPGRICGRDVPCTEHPCQP